MQVQPRTTSEQRTKKQLTIETEFSRPATVRSTSVCPSRASLLLSTCREHLIMSAAEAVVGGQAPAFYSRRNALAGGGNTAQPKRSSAGKVPKNDGNPGSKKTPSARLMSVPKLQFSTGMGWSTFNAPAMSSTHRKVPFSHDRSSSKSMSIRNKSRFLNPKSSMTPSMTDRPSLPIHSKNDSQDKPKKQTYQRPFKTQNQSAGETFISRLLKKQTADVPNRESSSNRLRQEGLVKHKLGTHEVPMKRKSSQSTMTLNQLLALGQLLKNRPVYFNISNTTINNICGPVQQKISSVPSHLISKFKIPQNTKDSSASVSKDQTKLSVSKQVHGSSYQMQLISSRKKPVTPQTTDRRIKTRAPTLIFPQPNPNNYF